MILYLAKFEGMPLVGAGVTGYDQAKKKPGISLIPGFCYGTGAEEKSQNKKSNFSYFNGLTVQNRAK
jgi:hypothetical protein